MAGTQHEHAGHQPTELARELRALLQAGSVASQSLSRRLGLGPTDTTALDHLLSTPEGLGPSELGQRLGIRSASATTLVDRLQATGHVRRVAHSTDRRRQTVVATPRAGDDVSEALDPLMRRIDAVVAGLSEEEAASTLRFLRDVVAAMHAYAEER